MKVKFLRLSLFVTVLAAGFGIQAQNSYTFTPCGAEGNVGPTQAEANTEYAGTNLDGDVTIVGGIQYWEVPTSGAYKIEAFGGQGYGPFGGRGAHISGEFTLTAGDTLKILVGQMAGHYLNYPSTTYNHQYGGGGGSFITYTDNTPLVVAGGGGGNHGTAYVSTCDGQITTSGASGSSASTIGAGGANGLGGQQASSADAGGGLLGNGDGTAGGQAFVNGGLGGIDEGTGGFGCGGGTSSWNNYRCGGGGGYSGGGTANNAGSCCPVGGGGGSFNAGTAQVNLAGVQIGDGSVIITPLQTYPNDAGIGSILGLTPPLCAGTYPVEVTVVNYGNNQITPVTVDWMVNGVAQNDTVITTLLDTSAGSGSSSVNVLLDSVTISGPTTITVWTQSPNNVNDTVNGNDTFEITIVPSLAGYYTIGAGGGFDYADFAGAVSDLNTYGVCDSVIFLVQSGTYNEQVEIGNITGSGATNTITFRSAVMDSSAVELSYTGTSANNYVVQFQSADYIRFEHMTIYNPGTSTYSMVLDFLSGSDYNIIRNCHLKNDYSSTSNLGSIIYSASGSMSEFNEFRNNLIENGSYAMYWYGSSTTSLCEGNVIDNNMFLNQYYYGVRLYYTTHTEFTNNEMTSNSAYATGYGMYLGYCDFPTITGNHLYSSGGEDWPQYGMYIYYCDGSLNQLGKVNNNLIVLGTPNSGTESHYAFYPYYNDFFEYANNTVVVRSGSTSSRAAYFYYPDFYYAYNNLFVNYSDGFAVDYNYGSGPLGMDNNAYWSPTGSFAEYDASTAANLSALQAASGFDANSYEVDPEFIDTIGGTHCNDSINGGAMPISGIAMDHYNVMRDPSTPDIGAVETAVPADIALADDTLCGNETTLEIFGPVENIMWNVNGNTTTGSSVVISTNNTGAESILTSVVFSTAYCGAGSSNANITLVPAADLDSNTHICADETATLSPGGGVNASYSWTPTGETTSTISVEQPGSYSVTIDELGCESETQTIVTKSVGVEIADIEECVENAPITVNGSVPNGLNYAWDGGTNPSDPINSFNDAGTYSITATDSFGCVSEDAFILDIIDVPVVGISYSSSAYAYIFSSSTSYNLGSSATYFWTFGDGTTSTDPNPSHIFPWSSPSSPAVYNVTLEITNDCGTSEESIIVTPSLGIESLESGEFTVFPNPATGTVNIKFAQSVSDVNIRILDMSGRVVKHEASQTGSLLTLDVSELTGGNYILEISDDLSVTQTKLIIH